jgi:hypothetical protein
MTMPRDASRALRALLLPLALLGAAASCFRDGPTPLENIETEDLEFLRALADAPPLANPVLVFWARRGRDEERVIWYRPRIGSADSSEFLRFRLDDRSLLSRPDGSAIAVGDSVLITISVVDPTQLVTSFQPSGLRFAAGREARLQYKLAETDEDRDHDGDVDEEDVAAETRLAIWRQEALGQPWVQLSSELRLEADEVEARLTGFTNYAVAYRKRR